MWPFALASRDWAMGVLMLGILRPRRVAAVLLAPAMVVLALTASQARASSSSTRPVASPPTATHNHTVSFDKYSLMLDGRRTFIWSGEFHPFRLPSPGLWRDVLQKMKATGYNAVSVYFDWGYHSPAPGVYDFTGVRDMDRLLDIAAAGRPVRDRATRARTSTPRSTAAAFPAG